MGIGCECADALFWGKFFIPMKSTLFGFRLAVIGCLLASSVVFSSCDKEEVTPVPEVNAYTLSLECAYLKAVTPNPRCFVDLDKGVAYTLAEASAHAADIDFVWHYYGNSAYYLRSPLSNIFSTASDGYDAEDLFAGWPARSATLIEYDASFSKADFEAVTNTTELTAFLAANQEPIQEEATFDGTSTTAGRMFTFETNLKKRGAFLVTANSTNSNGGSATITIKVTP